MLLTEAGTTGRIAEDVVDSPTTAPAARRDMALAPGVSTYIDLLRSVAALLVFVGHADVVFFDSTLPGILSHHAREAVAVFFVLSGFVISFATLAREGEWHAYLNARLARILPVVVLSLAVTLVCDLVGRSVNPDLYAGLGFYRPASPGAALSYLTFTNQLWFRHIVFGTNEPFWSLSFEVWYYVVFGLLIFTGGAARLIACLGWAAVCGPVIVLYLPLWLLGVALFDAHRRGLRLDWRVSLIVFPASLYAYEYVRRHFGGDASNMFEWLGPWQGLRNLGYVGLVGLLSCLNIVAGGALVQRFVSVRGNLARLIRWVSGASFTLYLTHLPLLVMLRAVVPASHAVAAWSCLACALALVLILAEAGERRKKAFADALARLIPPGRWRTA